MRYVFPLILILSLIAACKKHYSEQNKQLDGLLVELQQTNQRLSEVDTSTVFEVANKVKQDLLLLHQLVDTLAFDKAEQIAEAYSKRNAIFYFHENYLSFKQELEVSEDQLAKLKTDLNNGLLSDEKFKTYFNKEQTIIVNLNKKIKDAVEQMNEAFDELIKNTSKVEGILQEIKQNQEELITE